MKTKGKNQGETVDEQASLSAQNAAFTDELTAAFIEHRARLLNVARIRMSDALFLRMTPEDVLQETFLAAQKRLKSLQTNADVPIFVKLRCLLLQTLTDCERKYLVAQKRCVCQETHYDDPGAFTTQSVDRWNRIADSASSPRTHLARIEKHEQVRQILSDMEEDDREILMLRHFESLSNAEVALILNIDPSVSSARYVRALRRMQRKLEMLSGMYP